MRSVLWCWQVAIALAAACCVSWAAEPASSDVPHWAQEEIPANLQEYVGKSGLPAAWQSRPGPLGSSVAGIDRWQANHFLAYRTETAKFLYGDYTPLTVSYRRGTLPGFEDVVKGHTAGLESDRDKALALLTKALPEVCRHPSIPPCGPRVRPDRNLEDDALLASGGGWCNEQARVYVRLCQVAGIPARMVFLFYADNRSGHVIAEFYADGRWSLADTSWHCVFPDGDGKLLSAAEAHEPKRRTEVIERYRSRFRELLSMTDEQLGAENRPRLRQSLESKIQSPEEFGVFGILNYPLPR